MDHLASKDPLYGRREARSAPLMGNSRPGSPEGSGRAPSSAFGYVLPRGYPPPPKSRGVAVGGIRGVLGREGPITRGPSGRPSTGYLRLRSSSIGWRVFMLRSRASSIPTLRPRISCRSRMGHRPQTLITPDSIASLSKLVVNNSGAWNY